MANGGLEPFWLVLLFVDIEEEKEKVIEEYQQKSRDAEDERDRTIESHREISRKAVYKMENERALLDAKKAEVVVLMDAKTSP